MLQEFKLQFGPHLLSCRHHRRSPIRTIVIVDNEPFVEPQLEAIVRAAVESVERKRELERLARETRDPVRLLDTGVFRFRTMDEAQLLAIHLASACGQTDQTIQEERLIDSHGRGMLVASSMLDLVYKPPGNNVTVRLPAG